MTEDVSSTKNNLIIILGENDGELRLLELAKKSGLSYKHFDEQYGDRINYLADHGMLDVDPLDSSDPLISLTNSGKAIYQCLIDPELKDGKGWKKNWKKWKME